MQLKLITDKNQLDDLKGHSAQFENLKFEFSDQYIQQMKELLDEANAIQFFAVDDNQDFAGYVAAAEKNTRPGMLWIVELFVEPSFQGRGIASKLCKEIVERAKILGLSGVFTQTEKENLPAQSLYEKLGFVKVDNPDWQEGISYLLKLE